MHTFRMLAALVFALSAGAAATTVAGQSAPDELDKCNVVWTTPSKDAAGSMPLGNGEVGLNLWGEEGGDLRFYIARTDAYSEISRLLKVGCVRVRSRRIRSPPSAPFRQELRLRDGLCEITAGRAKRKRHCGSSSTPSSR